jgi:hypothetical protein
MEWAPRLVDAVVAAATALLVFLLAATVRLAVRDWLAERRTCRAWDGIVGPRADAPRPIGAGSRRGDHPYAPTAADPEICAILHAHRHSVPAPNVTAGGTDAEADPPACDLQRDQGPRAVPVSGSNLADDSSSEAAPALALRAVARHGLDWIAPTAPAAGGKVRRRRRALLAMQGRRVANATWRGADRTVQVLGIPIRIVSDIVVVGQGENAPPNGDSPHQQGNGRITEPVAAAAEARRQVVALAEALARQAAREDDAADAAEKRSRSPPGAQAEQSPWRRDKDDDTT